MSIASFLKEILTDSKTGSGSTKRLGHITGIFTTASVVFILVGILIGISLAVPAVSYQFVYTTLNNTLIALLMILTTGGTSAYIATKRTENKE